MPPRPAGCLLCSHGLHTAAFGPDRTEALRGLVIAEHVASLTLRYLNEPTGSYLVAERAQKTAEALDEPVMLGLAAFTRSHAAIASGLWTRALTIAGQAAEELRPHLARPEAPEVYGQLLLTQAYCRYAVDHTDEAADLVTEAGRIADHTGETTTLGLMFGPTNINFWRIAMEADGDSPGRAVEIARRTHPSGGRVDLPAGHVPSRHRSCPGSDRQSSGGPAVAADR